MNANGTRDLPKIFIEDLFVFEVEEPERNTFTKEGQYYKDEDNVLQVLYRIVDAEKMYMPYRAVMMAWPVSIFLHLKNVRWLR